MIKQDNERAFMQLAICEMEKSDGDVKVGVALVVGGNVVATGFRGHGVHAERMAIESALQQGLDLKAATLYSTLEPCVNLGSTQRQQCCAELIIKNEIREVVIGRYDPNPVIYRQGWKYLRDAGVRLRDFPSDLRKAIDDINRKFVNYFAEGMGPSGGAKIDHKDRGNFQVRYSPQDDRRIEISWTVAGVNAAYGYAVPPITVALARFAAEFEEIDDPTAFEFSHSARIEVGEVGIFLGPDACVLVKPKEIQSGPKYGTGDYFVKFDYLVRVFGK